MNADLKPGQHNARLCTAHDCPLAGVFSPSTLGTSEWLCVVHDRVEPRHWPAATEAIRFRAALFRLSEKLIAADAKEPIPETLRQSLRDRGRHRLADMEPSPATLRTYGAAIRARLVRECEVDENEQQAVAERAQQREGMAA